MTAVVEGMAGTLIADVLAIVGNRATVSTIGSHALLPGFGILRNTATTGKTTLTVNLSSDTMDALSVISLSPIKMSVPLVTAPTRWPAFKQSTVIALASHSTRVYQESTSITLILLTHHLSLTSLDLTRAKDIHSAILSLKHLKDARPHILLKN